MRNVHEVLREKESAMARVAREVEILRLAVPLLAHDAASLSDMQVGNKRPGDVRPDTVRPGDVRPDDVKPGDVRPEDDWPDVLPTDRPIKDPLQDPLADPLRVRPHASEIAVTDGSLVHGPFNQRRLSVLGLESDGVENEEATDAIEDEPVEGKKISSRLKRFTRPLVSFMAG